MRGAADEACEALGLDKVADKGRAQLVLEYLAKEFDKEEEAAKLELDVVLKTLRHLHFDFKRTPSTKAKSARPVFVVEVDSTSDN